MKDVASFFFYCAVFLVICIVTLFSELCYRHKKHVR